MDKQFLEFWSRVFALSAQGQQPMEELGKWCAQGFKGFQDITDLWAKMYGLAPAPGAPSASSGLWQDTMRGFQQSYAEFISLMDLVPRRDYEAVVQENEALKKTIRDLEEQITHLRALLTEKIAIPTEGARAFQALMNDQVQNYQSFMQNMTAALENLSAMAPVKAQPTAKKKATPK